MGWSIGYDANWERDIGYGVPAFCDHPGCGAPIHRGLDYVCGGDPHGGDAGCGLYFCSQHLAMPGNGPQLCERCVNNGEPFEPTQDRPIWLAFKLIDDSWEEWRAQNPGSVAEAARKIGEPDGEWGI